MSWLEVRQNFSRMTLMLTALFNQMAFLSPTANLAVYAQPRQEQTSSTSQMVAPDGPVGILSMDSRSTLSTKHSVAAQHGLRELDGLNHPHTQQKPSNSDLQLSKTTTSGRKQNCILSGQMMARWVAKFLMLSILPMCNSYPMPLISSPPCKTRALSCSTALESQSSCLVIHKAESCQFSSQMPARSSLELSYFSNQLDRPSKTQFSVLPQQGHTG